MSFLNSRDTEAATSFYGELFSWSAEPFEFGELTAFLFRLPGFVGGEPQQPVARDVVATMMPVDDGAEAHWGVDFWIGDTDAAAAVAEELGGGVIVARTTIRPFGPRCSRARTSPGSASISSLP